MPSHHPGSPVLITGASGTVGRLLAARLGALGWSLRLSDRAPFPDAVPAGATFVSADLQDAAAVERMATGCGLIIHLGGISVEQPFETVGGPNLGGVAHIYAAAQRNGARVVFASSNHVVGMYARTTPLDHDCLPRPDGFYGLSKAYGEMLGRLYWEKHGVETVAVRIGTVLPAPEEARHLATWISHDDLTRLMQCCARARSVGYAVIWGASRNSRGFWRGDDRARIGWAPQDSADGWAGEVGDRVSDDPVAEHHQGGRFAAMDFTRADLEPDAVGPLDDPGRPPT